MLFTQFFSKKVLLSKFCRNLEFMQGRWDLWTQKPRKDITWFVCIQWRDLGTLGEHKYGASATGT